MQLAAVAFCRLPCCVCNLHMGHLLRKTATAHGLEVTKGRHVPLNKSEQTEKQQNKHPPQKKKTRKSLDSMVSGENEPLCLS